MLRNWRMPASSARYSTVRARKAPGGAGVLDDRREGLENLVADRDSSYLPGSASEDPHAWAW
jgi:hypothetical protein